MVEQRVSVITMLNFWVLLQDISGTAKCYLLFRAGPEPRNYAFVFSGFGERQVRAQKSFNLGPSLVSSLRKQRLKRSGRILLYEGISECGFFVLCWKESFFLFLLKLAQEERRGQSCIAGLRRNSCGFCQQKHKVRQVSYQWVAAAGGSFISEPVGSVTTKEKHSLINRTSTDRTGFVCVIWKKCISDNDRIMLRAWKSLCTLQLRKWQQRGDKFKMHSSH
jgi:hypothetical protein